MDILLRIGTTVVIFALMAYSVAIVSEQRKRVLSKTVLSFLTLGVLLDLVATTFMILGSSKGAFTLHGVLGYSSLAAMFTDAVLMWRLKNKGGINSMVPPSLHLYSRYAYMWWVMAFITGGLLVAFR